MNLTKSLSIPGVVIYTLPIIITLFSPASDPTSPDDTAHPLETIEKLSRLAYLLIIVYLEDRNPVDFRSAWLYIAAVFLILYYLVWIRYFTGRRKVSLFKKAFLFVPMPLAVFLMLYYLCGAIWLRNLPAAIAALIFGVTYTILSYRSFGKSKVCGKYSKEAQLPEDTK